MPFDREGFKLMKYTLINSQDTFDCEDTNIAIANLDLLSNAMGIKVYKQTNGTCDEEKRFLYFNLMQGNKTEIEKIDDLCYNVKIKDCEILPATEKILAEMIYAYKTK
jgi:hypothetical protein